MASIQRTQVVTKGEPRHDEFPVLPAEATDLGTHVTQCARRYNALLRFHYDLSKSIRRQEVQSWVYRGFTFPLMCFICWELWKVVSTFS